MREFGAVHGFTNPDGSAQIDLLTPAPPSGPEALPYTRESGTYQAYTTWRISEIGTKVFAWVEQMALHQMAAGAKRVSPRTLIARARDSLHVPINDHFSPWIADDLVARRPELLDLIERRKRKKKATL